jgi:mannose-6-phosphate isomerase-like protein (cupin superfamily)
MKLFRLSDLDPAEAEHILTGIIPGRYLSHGGLGFKTPGQRSHDFGCSCKACDGKGRHVHADDCEVFIILQGRGQLQVDGKAHDLRAGDVVVCEPGEDHHLVADKDDPMVEIYLHGGDTPHWKKSGNKQ